MRPCIVLYGCLFAFLFGVPTSIFAEEQVLGPPGTIAAYELVGMLSDRPDFETQNKLSVVSATIRLGPVVEGEGTARMQWYNLGFARKNGDRFQLWLLMDSWPGDSHDPLVAQYLWQEPGWPDALNFVHEVSGKVQLPRLDLWSYGWPQRAELGAVAARAPAKGLPERMRLQGWLFRKVSTHEGNVVEPPARWTDLGLNPDLINGWLAFDRDKAGRPHYRLGKTEDGQPKGYEYVPKTAEELTAYRDAGANFAVTHPGKRARANFPDWLTRSSMYHNNLAYHSLDWPADLYRSNYWGFGNHVDEPGVHNWGLPLDTSDDALLPEIQAVNNLQRIVRQGVQQRGLAAIAGNVSKNFGLGTLQLKEGPQSIVTWEYEWPTAWYQLAVPDGVGGIVDEDVASNDLVEAYNMGLGTSIPPTVENAVAIRVAILRGAARNFNKKWGVAFYNPNEVKLKTSTIPLLYNKGASYFWYWTGWIGISDNSGLPYPYQLYYTSMVREAFLRNPKRNQDQLLRAARVAVVIPYGYTFTPYAMHRMDWLHLERENQFGIPYRRVLAHAAHEVERLLRQGIEFDVVVDAPDFHKTGYDELIYARADGTIRIDRTGQQAERRSEPRAFRRPYLGPGPRLSIEVIEPDDTAPHQVRLRAVGKLGTGEWAGERPEALVSWEIYGPDNRVRPSVFPEYGAVYTLQLERDLVYNSDPLGANDADVAESIQHGKTDRWTAGTYMIRAAMTDVFGRPAVAYRTFYVQDKR